MYFDFRKNDVLFYLYSAINYLGCPVNNSTNDIAFEDEALVGYIHRVAAIVAKYLGVAEQSFRGVINGNQDGGQTVNHIHLHVLAGKPLDLRPY
jgi:histidine triad (HIT) family protein